MIKVLRYLFLFTSFIACRNDNPIPVRYQKGDFWPENFRSNGLPGQVTYDNKLYCSTIEISSGVSNYLYCLNLQTGIVDWAAPVKNWASAPPIITDSFIYFCSYVGDLYKFDKNGNLLWYRQSNGPYASHTMDPLNQNLFVRTVSNAVFEYDCKTGDSIHHYGYGLGATLPVFDRSYMLLGELKEDSGTYLVCYDLQTRKAVWKIAGETGNRRLFTDNHKVYCTENGQTLCCRNIADGKLIWKTDSLSETGNELISIDPQMIFESRSLFYLQGTDGPVFEINKNTGVKSGTHTIRQLIENKKIRPWMKKRYTYERLEKEYTIIVSENNMMSDFFNRDLFVELLPVRNIKR